MLLQCCYTLTHEIESYLLDSLAPESKPVRLPKTWPHVIRNGDVAVKIYKNKGHMFAVRISRRSC
jgi:hypothetical protein